MPSLVKQVIRRTVERVLTPHLEAQTDEIERRLAGRVAVCDAESPPGDPDDLVLHDFNHLLHELRSIELRRLPADGGVLLSAGCAGLWYFDWLEECAGPFTEHIGVELYSPEPSGLGPTVRWIAQSANDMSQVTDATVDVVFSGQNLEHLWIGDLCGFLLEAHRVLRPGGVLVVDSPNRIVTEALAWSHPEHTIELAPREACRLLTLAGFDVISVRGLWNCRDQRTGGWLPLPASSAREILRRSVGRRSVDDDFVWWIEARRADRPVDPARVSEMIEGLFDRHWTARVNRAAECPGERDADGRWRVDADAVGVVYRTSGFPLFAGCYCAAASDPRLGVRLMSSTGDVLASATGHVDVTLDETLFGVNAELYAEHPLDEPITDVQVTVQRR